MNDIHNQLRAWAERALSAIVARIARGGISANQVSVAGCAICLTAAPLLLTGWPTVAGIVFLLGASLDVIDGMLARRTAPTRFGQVLDSTMDRLGEGGVFAGVILHFAWQGSSWLATAAAVALVSAFLTSYVRARAEAIGISCDRGGVTRLERVVVLGLGMTLGLLPYAVVVLAVGGSVTVAQRLAAVRQVAADR